MSTRRTFIKRSILGTAGTLLVPNFLKALESDTIPLNGKKVVIIQLSGGNDGLNTIIPYTNDLYYKFRPGLAIARDQVLKATGDLGFHPALAKLNALYDHGYLAVLNNVGYPNPDRSHFRSMDIWQTASDTDTYLTSGWIGRYLDSNCATCHAAREAIEVDDTLSLALKGESIKGIAMKNPEKLYKGVHNNLFHSIAQANTSLSAGESSLQYLYKTMAETVSSAEFIHDKAKVARTQSSYPQNEFSNRLKTVAELISSGVDTHIYYVSMSGFDTHVNQVNQHERLLTTYAEGVHAFVTDLGEEKMKDVLILTFSEFGRRVAQNASGGTDHGTANNVFLMSGSLKQKGFLNETPDLSSLDQGDLIHKIDFRCIYATILNKWLEVPPEKILRGSFNTLNFI